MDHTIVHFEIPAKDVQKLNKFYSDLFGWRIDKPPGQTGTEYWMVGTVPVDEQQRPLRPGVNGGMYKKERKDAVPINYISVESIDDYLRKIRTLGGKVIVPKQEVIGMGWSAVARDPEGNEFGLFQQMRS
jgi:predicted enzyme related to lactoylglutathione lyase